MNMYLQQDSKFDKVKASAEWHYIIFQPCREGDIPSNPKDYIEISASPFVAEACITGDCRQRYIGV